MREGNICCIKIRQENATCAIVLAGRTSIRDKTLKRETILPVQDILDGCMFARSGVE
jgi:hypothetical protein